MKIQHLFVLLVVLLLAACAGKEAMEETSDEGTMEETPVEQPVEETPMEETMEEEAVEAAPAEAEFSLMATSCDPSETTISAGGTIVWKNADDSVKYISSGKSELFDPQKMQPDEEFSFTFENAGEYVITNVVGPKYQCKVTVE